MCVSQETKIRATEKDVHCKGQSINISNRYGGEEVTHTLGTESREDMQRWMEAFWQQFYDMSERIEKHSLIAANLDGNQKNVYSTVEIIFIGNFLMKFGQTLK